MKKRSAKGQIQMFETVGVLVIFFFLLMIGAVFYFRAQNTSLQREGLQASNQRAFQTTLKALYLPELDCSFLKMQKENCIDLVKLQKFQEFLEENQNNTQVMQDYFTELGFASITVSELYPQERHPVLYDNPPDEFTDKIVKKSPVLLYDPLRDEYGFGIIEVDVYV